MTLDRNILIIFSITLIAVLGVSSITPALPAISRAFDISTREVAWLVAIFTLPGVVLTPVAGLLADRFGRKRILVPSLALFAVAGSACAMAGDFGDLLVLRALQGIGAASLGSINVTLIGDIYSGNQRTTAMGYNSAVISVAAGAYPLVGGALTVFGWRYPFLMPLLAVPIALCVLYGLKIQEPQRFDRLGPYLRKLMMSVGNAEIATMFFSSFVVFALLYGPLVTYLPFLLEGDFAAGSLTIGVVVACSAVGSAAASVFLGAMARRWHGKAIILFAFVFLSAPMAALPYMPDLWSLGAMVVIFGASHGIALSMVQVLLAELTPSGQLGAVMALNGMMFRLGQTLGPLFSGLVFAVGGMDAVFVGAAVLGGLTTVMLSIAMPGGRDKAG